MLSSCCRYNTIYSKSDITDKANTIIGKKCTCVPNDIGTHFLCSADDDPKLDPLRIVFTVIDINGEVAIAIDRVHGSVSWHDYETIKIIKYSRVINKGEQGRAVIKYLKIEQKR